METTIIKILTQEHKTIRTALGIMNRIALDIEAGNGFDSAEVESIADFLKVFVDRCHHGKEENCLFPALVSAGIPYEDGPVGQMLHEHATGRGYIREIRIGIENNKRGIEGSGSLVAYGLTNYVSLLQNHMLREEKVLFPLAAKFVNKQQQSGLIKQFEEIEKEMMGNKLYESYPVWLNRLKVKYPG